MYKVLALPLLRAYSRRDAEDAHELALEMLRNISARPKVLAFIRNMTRVELPPKKVLGLTFKSPLGLAAGFDKNGVATPALAALGFGFIEIGTVVPKPQEGNPRPRLFRLIEDQALINRMGFNSDGMEVVAENLCTARAAGIPIGINIGKNKETENKDAALDYEVCIDRLYSYADFFIVNVSSPNTPGLRELQGGNYLGELLRRIKVRIEQSPVTRHIPFLVKFSPDLTEAERHESVDTALAYADGVVFNNTTTTRSAKLRSKHKGEVGGYSGPDLYLRLLRSVEDTRKRHQKSVIIAVGGISDGEDGKRALDAGADLFEIFNSFIYGGPMLPYRINRYLASRS